MILTVTAGNGHNACAKGMKATVERIVGGGACRVKIVDLLKSYSTGINVWLADEGYNIAVGRLRGLYNLFYDRYLAAKPYKRYSCPSQSAALSTLDGLLREIISFCPDVIYCTHFYGAIAITDLRLVYPLPCKCFAACLDYVNSPFWEAGIGLDYLVIPNEDFIDEFMREGYRREQLLPIGIPVNDRTLVKSSKEDARKSLGLDVDVFTAVVMFGGGHWRGGLRIFEHAVKALKGKRAQIIMINGSDKNGFRKIAEMKFEKDIRVLNIGSTDDISTYYAAADVVLNKCGGTSATEIINKSIPMLITEKLAAQEKHNLKYLKEKGVALSFKNGKELKERLLSLLDDADLRTAMSDKTEALRKNATENLAHTILEQPYADYDGFLEMLLLYGDDLRAERAVKRALKKADKRARKERI